RSSGRLTANAPSANDCFGDMWLSQLRGSESTVAPDFGRTARGRVEQWLRIGKIALERECGAAQSVAVYFRPGGAGLLRIEQRFGAIDMRECAFGVALIHVVARECEIDPGIARIDL